MEKEELFSDVDPSNSYRSITINELTEALAHAQGEFTIATRSNENKYYRHRYEDLVDVVGASRPALTKHGLAVIQQIKQLDDGSAMLHTILTHSSGQWIETRTKINPPKQEIQSLTSYIACLKRLAYSSLVGVVAAGDDDDGYISDTPYREKFIKGEGSSIKKSNQKYEVISTEQREELELELADPVMEGYLEEIYEAYKIQSLADIPKEQYHHTRNRLMEIKRARKRGL